MAVITVTDVGDNLVVDGQVTLREAIRAAELDTSVDGSVAGNGPDTIVFAGALDGDVAVSGLAFQSAFDITSAITIRGNSNGIKVRRDAGAPESRLFRVLPGGSLRIESLTLANGAAVGVSPTPVGGEGRGGAIYNLGTIQIVSSTLTGNSARGSNGTGGAPGGAGLGGAIYNDGGNVSIVNSTLSENSAASGSGGSMPSSLGGGVFSRNGSLSVFNSTITANSSTAGRGVYVLADNATATAEIQSTIIGQADSTFGTTEFVATEDGGGLVATSGENNLIRGLANNFHGTIVSAEDPKLGPLADNGGPTWTHALAVDSPAVDQGGNLMSLASDQRGGSYLRYAGDGPDIGAYEHQSSGGPAISGDYNRDNAVGAADYVVWRNTRDAVVAPFAGADGNGDGRVDDADYGVWRANFGRTSASASVSESTSDHSAAPAGVAATSTAADRRPGIVTLPAATSLRVERAATRTPGSNFFPLRRADALEWALIDLLDARRPERESAPAASPHRGAGHDSARNALAIDSALTAWPAALGRTL